MAGILRVYRHRLLLPMTTLHNWNWEGRESFHSKWFPYDWKHASSKKGVLQLHDKCAVHRGAMLAWEQSKHNASCGTSVAHILETGGLQQIQNNCQHLRTIIQALLFCAHQEIAFRGHDEQQNSTNRGNFIELLELLAKHDNVVMERIKDGPRNAMYTSPQVQNLLLNIMANMVQNTICSARQSS